MELKNQVSRLIKNYYGLAQCLRTFTEDDLKIHSLPPQPEPSGTVLQEPGPADGEGNRSSVQQHTVLKTDGINKDSTRWKNRRTRGNIPTKTSSLICQHQRI